MAALEELMYRILALSLMVGCGGGDKSDSGLNDGGDTGSAEPGLAVAAVGAPSNGECPDMSETNTSVFVSSNMDRVVTMVIPEDPSDDMPLVFFFHGLMDPSQTPTPTEYMASGLGLQAFANRTGTAFAVPQSDVISRVGFTFFMWDVTDSESADMTLFDDIRACASQNLSVDLRRVHAVGMSGGALFTTTVAGARGDSLASIVEMSGGSDIDMLTFDTPLSSYYTPAYAMPALLVAGGTTDTWPGGGLTLVDFRAATDTLEDQLVADDHFVVRCDHTQGHAIPMAAIEATEIWVGTHRFGEPSSIQASGIDDIGEFNDWCGIAN